MTSRTVEVERTVTDEEEVLFCDYCGEDEEADKGEMRTYENDYGPDLHLHIPCSETGLGDMGPKPSFNEVSAFNLLFTMDSVLTTIFFFSLACLLLGTHLLNALLLIVGGIAFSVPLFFGFWDAKGTREKWNNQH